jgi:hypothetical protein
LLIFVAQLTAKDNSCIATKYNANTIMALLDTIPAQHVNMVTQPEHHLLLQQQAGSASQLQRLPHWEVLDRPDHLQLLLLLEALEQLHAARPHNAAVQAGFAFADTLSTLRFVDELTQLRQQHNAMHIYGHGTSCRLNNRPFYMAGTGFPLACVV